MNDKENTTLITLRKVLLMVAIVVTVCSVAISILTHFGVWDKLRDIEAIRAWVESKGPYAIIVYAALVLAQVIILPIPSTVTNLVAIMLFKPWVAFVVTSLATIAGSYVCFIIGRIFGKKLVTWLVGKDKTDKYANIIEEKGKLLFILMLALPCFPDDVLCMVAGLSTISLRFFSLTVILARPVMIAVVSFFGGAAIEALDTWGLPVSIGVILLVLVAVMLVVFRRDSKKRKNKIEK